MKTMKEISMCNWLQAMVLRVESIQKTQKQGFNIKASQFILLLSPINFKSKMFVANKFNNSYLAKKI